MMAYEEAVKKMLKTFQQEERKYLQAQGKFLKWRTKSTVDIFDAFCAARKVRGTDPAVRNKGLRAMILVRKFAREVKPTTKFFYEYKQWLKENRYMENIEEATWDVIMNADIDATSRLREEEGESQSQDLFSQESTST
ncbi:uncharacterized protein [Amphiura filiformis]|uniref:uncharacterized protein n=1 Tax=Amphiura filiformis TaxID=82378 RepID=UPI003B224B2C